MKKMRCAVVGGMGYLGKHLVRYLQRYSDNVMVYDIIDSENECYRRIDLRDRASVEKINFDVDYIFVFSGVTGTYAGFSTYDKFVVANEIGLLNLLDTIQKSKFRPKVIFPSTRLVYMGRDAPLRESDEKETKTIYAANKLACEGYLQAYKSSFDIPYTIFRICLPYGNMLSTDYSFGTVGSFIRQASAEKVITLYGGGTMKRTFTHIEDLCYQVVEGAIKNESNGEAYNVGGEILSLYDAAEIVAAKFGTKVVSVPWPEKDLRIESGDTYFDDTKIVGLLGAMTYKRLADFSKDI